eukprot:TRINITY_DN65758_c9_g13_i3.p2 TRINITY_DN65758_c9_g13~~TRINITY_DN65758_c9_g13_i3.p2  ORF type:complete len:164 (+),score=80.05 TRINITY_DN65758_c9_g13_i3:295-786(+)
MPSSCCVVCMCVPLLVQVISDKPGNTKWSQKYKIPLDERMAMEERQKREKEQKRKQKQKQQENDGKESDDEEDELTEEQREIRTNLRKTIHKSEQKPIDKFKYPQTASQDIGWDIDQVLKEEGPESDELSAKALHYGREKSDVTKYGDAYAMMYGRSPFANKS